MPTVPTGDPMPAPDVTGFPTAEDRESVDRVFREWASDSVRVDVLAQVLALARRKAFNEGAVAGMKLSRTDG